MRDVEKLTEWRATPSMNYLTIKGTNLRITEAIDAYLRKKIDHIEKFLQPVGLPKDVFVEIVKTTQHRKKGPYFRCEVNIRLPKKILRAEATTFDLYAAIDLVRDELERQVRAYRDKMKSSPIRAARKTKAERSSTSV